MVVDKCCCRACGRAIVSELRLCAQEFALWGTAWWHTSGFPMGERRMQPCRVEVPKHARRRCFCLSPCENGAPLPCVLVHDHDCMRGVCTTCDIAERCPKTCGLPMSCLRHTLRRTWGACMLRGVYEELCLCVVGHLPYCGLSLSLSLSLLSVTCACPCLPLSFCGMMTE